VTLGIGLLSLLLLIPERTDLIGRGRGVFLLATYAVFVMTIVVSRHRG
jgi:Ca2+/Na+ antiporter